MWKMSKPNFEMMRLPESRYIWLENPNSWSFKTQQYRGGQDWTYLEKIRVKQHTDLVDVYSGKRVDRDIAENLQSWTEQRPLPVALISQKMSNCWGNNIVLSGNVHLWDDSASDRNLWAKTQHTPFRCESTHPYYPTPHSAGRQNTFVLEVKKEIPCFSPAWLGLHNMRNTCNLGYCHEQISKQLQPVNRFHFTATVFN